MSCFKFSLHYRLSFGLAIFTIFFLDASAGEHTVFYATSRELSHNYQSDPFTSSFSKTRSYGYFDATIVHGGLIPILFSKRITPTADYNEWIREMKATSEEKEGVLIYVHGFRNSFEKALQDGAILSEGIDKAIPIVYSWPALTIQQRERNWFKRRAEEIGNIPMEYVAAVQVERESINDFYEFTEAVSDSFGGKANVSIVAHSFGSRLLVGALAKNTERNRFRNIVMVAPDYSKERFDSKRGLIEGLARRLTIYFAEDDIVLPISAAANADRKEKGTLGNQFIGKLFNSEKTDVIDSSGMGRTLFGHSYHVTSPAVRDDISILIDSGRPASQRPEYLKRIFGKSKEKSWFTFRKKTSGTPLRSGRNMLKGLFRNGK